MSCLLNYFTSNVSWKTVWFGIAPVPYLTNYFEACLPNSPGIQEDKLLVDYLLQWLPVEFLLFSTLPVILLKSVAHEELLDL